MEHSIRHPRRAALTATLVACAALAGALSALPTRADDKASAPAPSAQGWLVKSYEQIERPAAPAIGANEQAALKAMVAKRKPEDIARFQWWAAGGPVYRWNEMILDEMHVSFVTLPLSVRHLALFHAALDDAVAAAWHYKGAAARPGVVVVDGALKASGSTPASPSDFAAAAAAAAEMLAYLFPARAAEFAPRPRRRCRCACWPARNSRATSRPAARSAGASRRSPSPAASRMAPTRCGAAAFRRGRARGRAPIPSRLPRGPGRRGC